ncbi:hypothetical protein PC111_g11457 [Phytophthora cactorum]|nr:hypothetical protein PC111_g11457 [Phytophthora cactorum]KAG3055604.1 hypothetical protein PC122_g21674 [Phytophthora cactorum]
MGIDFVWHLLVIQAAALSTDRVLLEGFVAIEFEGDSTGTTEATPSCWLSARCRCCSSSSRFDTESDGGSSASTTLPKFAGSG